MAGVAQWQLKIESNVESLLLEIEKLKKSAGSVVLDIDTEAFDEVVKKLNNLLEAVGSEGNFKNFENLDKQFKNVVSSIGEIEKSLGGIKNLNANDLISSIKNIDVSLSSLSEHIKNVNNGLGDIGGSFGIDSAAITKEVQAAERLIKANEKLSKAKKEANRTKVSESSYIEDRQTYTRLVTEMLSKDGGQVLGSSITTKLEDGLVRVHGQIKDIEGEWRSFTVKVDGDLNLTKPSFGKALSRDVEKLNAALKKQKSFDPNFDYERQAETYNELISKIKEYNKVKTTLAKGRGTDENRVQAEALLDVIKELQKQDILSPAQISETNALLKEVEANIARIEAETQKKSSDKIVKDAFNAQKNINKVLYGGAKPYTQYEGTEEYANAVKKAEKALNDLKLAMSKLSDNEPIPQSVIENLKKCATEAKKATDNLSAMQHAGSGTSGDKALKLQRDVAKYLQDNGKISKNFKKQLEDIMSAASMAGADIDKLTNNFLTLQTQIAKTEQEGKSFAQRFKDSFVTNAMSQVASYFFSVMDIINYLRQGFETIKELDAALTEQRKVSDESLSVLEKYKKESYAVANSVGTTGLQIQKSTADWMRLGESIQTATESAKAANVLFNVSEFESIDEATKALTSTSQAFKDLDKMEIVDVVNKVGNEFSIATDELSTALQDSAAALTTQGNDLAESVALITAGNAITQNASKTAGGVRTISLRIAGRKMCPNIQ